VLGKSLNFLRVPVRGKLAEDADRVASLFVALGWKRVLQAMSHPEPAMRVEFHIHRLVNLGLLRHKLDLESWWQMEFCPLFGGRQGGRFGDERLRPRAAAHNAHHQ
jgi:hypothetical protein